MISKYKPYPNQPERSIKSQNFRPTNSNTTKNTNGFSLIEVLVSMLILSIGIIGIIKLQLTSLKTTQQSHFYSTGMQVATDLAQKMHSNNTEMAKADNSNQFLKIDHQSGTSPASVGLCYANDCDTTALANADIYEWLTKVNTALPNAKIKVCRDTTPLVTANNDFKWDCTNDAKASIVIKLGWDDTAELTASTKPRIALNVTPYFKNPTP